MVDVHLVRVHVGLHGLLRVLADDQQPGAKHEVEIRGRVPNSDELARRGRRRRGEAGGWGRRSPERASMSSSWPARGGRLRQHREVT